MKHFCFDFDQTIVRGHFHNALWQLLVMPAEVKMTRDLVKNVFLAPNTELAARYLHGTFIEEQLAALGPLSEYEKSQATERLTKIKDKLLGAKNVQKVDCVVGFKNEAQLIEVIQKIREKGHKISILGVSSYPEAIKETLDILSLKMKVSPSLTEEVVIESFVPGASVRKTLGKQQHLDQAIAAWKAKGVTFEGPPILIDDDKNSLEIAQQNNCICIQVFGDNYLKEVLAQL